MNNLPRLFLYCILATFCLVALVSAQTTEFTYQGSLKDGASPANGSYDFEFVLYDALTGGSQDGATLSRPGVVVTNGIFAVRLDFGNQFPGSARFFETHVRLTGQPGFTPLTPRQSVSSAPYNVKSLNSDDLGGVAASQYVQTNDSRFSDSRSPTAGSANYIQNTNSAQSANFNISGNGALGGTLTASNRLGVGTLAPLAPLDVHGNVFVGLTSDPSSPGANSVFLANDGGDSHNSFRIDGAGDNLYIIGRSNAGAGADTGIIFRTATKGTGEVDQVKIDSLGNVGIGTDSPGAKLHVIATAVGGAGIYTFGGNFTSAMESKTFGTGLHADGGDNSNSGGYGGYGVTGLGGGSPGIGGDGVVGTGGDGTGNNSIGGVGIVGVRGNGPGFSYAGLFNGSVNILGNLIVTGSKDFQIDDPLDPQNKYLLHAAMESSEVLNVYSGNVVVDKNGEAVVKFPSWFQAINRDFRYQLTAIGGPAQGLYIAEEVKNNQFKIAGGVPGMKVSWQVTGVRSDALMLKTPFKVEEDKPERERGSYLSPEAFGQPEEKGVEWARRPQLMNEL